MTIKKMRSEDNLGIVVKIWGVLAIILNSGRQVCSSGAVRFVCANLTKLEQKPGSIVDGVYDGAYSLVHRFNLT